MHSRNYNPSASADPANPAPRPSPTAAGALIPSSVSNPSASADPANPALGASATYPVDMGFQSRSSLLKFRYSFNANTHFLVSALSADTWDDKTGNGDNDSH